VSDKSKIEWTDSTWTPIRARRRDTGKVGVHCERVSPACKNCYADLLNRRNLPQHGTGLEFTILNREKVEIFVDEQMLMAPLRWKRPRKIFVCSQTDLFGEFVTDDMIDRVFAVMALCPQHTFQVLTKRPERMLKWTQGIDDNDGGWIDGECYRDSLIEGEAQNIYCKLHPAADPSEWLAVHLPLPNVWLGITAENQEWADKRIPLLLQTTAAKRFVSVEPMLGPVDLRDYLRIPGMPERIVRPGSVPVEYMPVVGLDWVICGGESGHGARPMHPNWARSLRDQCVAAGVPFHFKQWGEWMELPVFRMSRNVMDNRSYRIALRKYVKDNKSSGWLSADHLLDGVRETCLIDGDKALGKVGKKAAGRLLDGVEWNQFPEESK